jgi:hypothetical protein
MVIPCNTLRYSDRHPIVGQLQQETDKAEPRQYRP